MLCPDKFLEYWSNLKEYVSKNSAIDYKLLLTESLSTNANFYHKKFNASSNEEKQWQEPIDTKASFNPC